jgi:hypothetical protein
MADSTNVQGLVLRIHNQDGDPGTYTVVGRVQTHDIDSGQPNLNEYTATEDTSARVRPGLPRPGTYTFGLGYKPQDAGQTLVKAAVATPQTLIKGQLEYNDDEGTPNTYTIDFDGYWLTFQKTGEADGLWQANLTIQLDILPTETIT